MSLTVATGPLAENRAGRFNFDTPEQGAILWDPVPHRIRAIFARETIVDSTRVKLLHETGHLPVYYFPRDPVADRAAAVAVAAHPDRSDGIARRGIRDGEEGVRSVPPPLPRPPDVFPRIRAGVGIGDHRQPVRDLLVLTRGVDRVDIAVVPRTQRHHTVAQGRVGWSQAHAAILAARRRRTGP